MVSITWSQALAWRLRRQLLDPVGTESVAGVVRRLGAVPAQLDAAAELAVRARRERSRPGEVARALVWLAPTARSVPAGAPYRGWASPAGLSVGWLGRAGVVGARQGGPPAAGW